MFCFGMVMLLFLTSCQSVPASGLESFEVFCEMVGSDAKPLALSHPMDPETADLLWEDFQQVAGEHQVLLYREDDFPDTRLFPAGTGEGKSVVLIYRGKRLQQYLQWKEDLEESSTSGGMQQDELARRLGRLLGYSPQGINKLLRQHSEYRDLASFGIERQITHLYYDDLQEAKEFYSERLGLKQIGESRFQISADAFLELHPFDAFHGKEQPKSTAIALLTDQLPEWYALIGQADIPVKYTYKPREGGPHDGFVAIDPGGYLLEFEQFKQHRENERFMAELGAAPRVATTLGNLDFYGSITWTYHDDLLRMQRFYEEVLGFPLVADQGWTKIYQASPTGFIGLVDERRGMEDYADEKAVELQWNISDFPGFDTYAETNWKEFGYGQGSITGPEKYVYRIKDTEE